MKKEVYVKVCPMCGHDKIQEETEKALLIFNRKTGRATCGKCNYNSSMFPEIHIDHVEDYINYVKEMVKK